MGDKYAIIKGKALTMVREFQKVYPKGNPILRIENEVWYAANYEFPDTKDIDTNKLHRIISEIKEAIR